MTASVTPFLMFVGQAEAATNFYVATVPNSAILSLERWAEGEPGPKGAWKRASVRIGGQRVICFDSPAKHDFTFTPSFSLFVECDSEAEIDRLYAAFIEGGQGPDAARVLRLLKEVRLAQRPLRRVVAVQLGVGRVTSGTSGNRTSIVPPGRSV